MKIRTGFVSNSSSSSFVAWGVSADDVELANDYDDEGFEKGGQEYDFVGLTVDWFMENHPELTFGEVKKFVADKLNKRFRTNFTDKDISYREEGWYDG